MNNQFSKLLSACVLSAGLVACSGTPSDVGGTGGGTTAASALPIAHAILPISVAATGTIPLFKGTNTNAGVYIHNDGNVQISNIIYQLDTNASLNQRAIQLDSSHCSVIPAHSACYLPLPILGGHDAEQGSFSQQLSIIYNDTQGNIRHFNHILNFRYVDETTTGVFATSLALSNYGNKLNRGVVYVYATGKPGSIYTVDSLTLANNGLKIDSGNISGFQLASGQVQAIEVSGSALETNWGTNTLTVVSSNDKTQFTSSAQLTLKPLTASQISNGFIPAITPDTVNSGKVYFQNTGGVPVKISSITSSTEITPSNTGANPCSEGTALQPGDGCTVAFSIESTALTSFGSGEIDVNSADRSLTGVGQVVWYNKRPFQGAITTTENNALWLTKGVQTTVPVTINNNGESSLNNLTILPPSGGNGLSIKMGNGSCGNTLAAGSSCTYYAFITANVAKADVNRVTFKYAANYTPSKIVKGRAQIDYIVNNAGPALNINADADTFDIVGNGTEAAVVHYTISNNGSVAANISSISLDNNPSGSFTDSGGTCYGISVLPAGTSCTETITLGPVSATANESSELTYSVSGSFGVVSKSTPYTIVNPADGLRLVGVNVVGAAKGDGTVDNPYLLLGSNSTAKSVVLTYANAGSHTQSIRSITDSNSVSDWQLDLPASSCYAGDSANKQLASGESCTVGYVNVYNLDQSRSDIVAGTNLNLPKFGIQSSAAIVYQQPELNGSSLIHVSNHQATVINRFVVVANGSLAPVAQISHTLTNASGYNNVTLNSSFDNSPFKASAAKGGCSVSSDGSKINNQCGLIPNSTVTETLPININTLKTSPYELNIGFTSSISTSQTLGMNVFNDYYLLDQVAYKGYYIIPVKQDVVGGMPQVMLCTVGWDNIPGNCVSQSLTGNFSTTSTTIFRGTAVYQQWLYILNGVSITRCPINIDSVSLGTCVSQNISNQVANLQFTQSAAIVAADKIYWVSKVNSVPYLLTCDINHNSGTLANCKTQLQLSGDEYSYIATDYVNNHAYILQDGSDRKYIMCDIGTSGLTNCQDHVYPNGFPKLGGINPVNIIYDGYLYALGSAQSAKVSCSLGSDGLINTCQNVIVSAPFDDYLSSVAFADNSGHIMFSNFPASGYYGTATLNNGSITDWQNLGYLPNTASYFGAYWGQ